MALTSASLAFLNTPPKRRFLVKSGCLGNRLIPGICAAGRGGGGEALENVAWWGGGAVELSNAEDGA